MDRLTPEQRRKTMQAVKGKNTSPEVLVRQYLHRQGYRFRLHRKDLPGKPDIVLPKYKTVIFINGCFWHRHQGCKQATMPASNIDYWEKKFKRTQERDNSQYRQLEKLGWKVVIVWECEVENMINSMNKYIFVSA